MNKKRALQIILPIAIVLLIGGMWLLKSDQTSGEVQEGPFALAAEDTLDVSSLIEEHGLPVMLDFSADYCPPCRTMEPALKSMHQQMQGKLIIKQIDTEKNYDLASQYPVQVIPTQIFITAEGKPYEPSQGLGISFTQYHYEVDGSLAYTLHEGLLTEDEMREIFADMGVE